MDAICLVTLNYGAVGEGEGEGIGEADALGLSVGAGVYDGSGTNALLGTVSVVGPIPQVAWISENFTPVCNGIGLTKKIV